MRCQMKRSSPGPRLAYSHRTVREETVARKRPPARTAETTAGPQGMPGPPGAMADPSLVLASVVVSEPQPAVVPWVQPPLESYRPPSPHSRRLQGLALFGITAREAQLYLALVAHGPLRAHDATIAAGLQRATGYRIILRLLQRGLISSSGSWPQLFHALPLGTVHGRMQTFFTDEEELRHQLTSCYGNLSEDPLVQSTERPPVQIVSSRGSGSSMILQEIANTRHQIDLMIRVRSVPSRFRNDVARALARAVAQGVRVRMLTDASSADGRFLAHVYRDFDSASCQLLEVRHYSPLVGHFYVLDSGKTLRFSALGGFARAPDVGILSSDPEYVRNQLTRFEALWVEGVPAGFNARSIRATGWLTYQQSTRLLQAP